MTTDPERYHAFPTTSIFASFQHAGLLPVESEHAFQPNPYFRIVVREGIHKLTLWIEVRVDSEETYEWVVVPGTAEHRIGWVQFAGVQTKADVVQVVKDLLDGPNTKGSLPVALEERLLRVFDEYQGSAQSRLLVRSALLNWGISHLGKHTMRV